jgi:hypothetical protein
MDAGDELDAGGSPLEDWLVPIGLLLVLGGAAAALAGACLFPFVRSLDPSVALDGNRAVLFPVGWYVIAGALAAPSLAFGRWLGSDVPWWIVSMLGACGIVVAALAAVQIADWSVYDFDFGSAGQISTDGVRAAAGVWAIGLGSAAAALGGWMLVRVPLPPERAEKAEQVASAGPPPEGWYHDPEVAEQLRWWDGTRWGEARRPLPPLARWAPPQAPGTVAEPSWPAAAADDAGRPAPLWRRPENDPPQ